jgi:hypothetical protein
MLGSAVPGRVSLAFNAGNGTDVDDVAASFQQIGQCGPAQVERSAQVDREVLCPVVVGRRLCSAHLVLSGDVDEDVESAELLDALVDRVSAGLRRSNVHRCA